MYRIEHESFQRKFDIVLVGCGGTGGHVAEGLCRLLIGRPQVRLHLIDHDRVEPQNLGRQNFYPEDLGAYKAEVLATRLARKYNRPIAYSLNPFTHPLDRQGWTSYRRLWPGILIGCVDNALARSAMHEHMVRGPISWWVDAGNGEDYGQVLLGNAPLDRLRWAFDEEQRRCGALPLPTIQRPELLTPPAPVEAPGDCAEAVATGDQSPTINHAMASAVLEVVHRLIEGRCSWMGLSIDLGAGMMTPVHLSPHAVARATGVSVRRLVRKAPRKTKPAMSEEASLAAAGA